jgi:hypothetical protein
MYVICNQQKMKYILSVDGGGFDVNEIDKKNKFKCVETILKKYVY